MASAVSSALLTIGTRQRAGLLQVFGYNTIGLLGRNQTILPFLIRSRAASTMATPWRIRVPASDTGVLKWKQTDEAAAKVSELLQKDLEVFYSEQLSVWAKEWQLIENTESPRLL
jgi:hypothetical protein